LLTTLSLLEKQSYRYPVLPVDAVTVQLRQSQKSENREILGNPTATTFSCRRRRRRRRRR
jgi:hypothetical protein